MPNIRSPRKGSMQFWPRKRARSIVPRTRTYTQIADAKIAGFAGYKVGMIQASYVESRKTSPKKGQEIVVPVTILECPPLKVYSIRLYKKNLRGNFVVAKEIVSDNIDKILKRTLPIPKSNKTKEILDSINIADYCDVRLNVYTQPKITSLGKKKPELFEMGIGGSLQQKWDYAKSVISKDIFVSDIFKENQLVDVHSVTTGKGTQGPVKRFGVSLRHHKSEKTKRGPGSLGGWAFKGKYSWSVAHAGQMGFHLRTELNKLILKIVKSSDVKDMNPKGGITNYGIMGNDLILVSGSVAGPKKRMIKLLFAQRPNDKLPLPPNTPVEIIKNY